MYRKCLLLILIAVSMCFITSCSMITSKEYLTKAESSKIENENKIWVTTTDGVEYKLSKPKIQDSMIVGMVYNKEGMHKEVKEIEISKIAFVRAEEFDNGKVKLYILGVGILAISLGLIVMPSLYETSFIY